jgi:hypothetical protein
MFDWTKSIGGKISDGLSAISPDFVRTMAGDGDKVQNYDANGNLEDSKKKAGAVYDDAMGQSAWIADHAAPGMGGEGKITAQDVNAPAAIQAQQVNAPDRIQAQNIGTPNTIQGDQADALRSQQLAQAQIAANSPSAAAAQMKAAGQQVANQQMGQAAMARGPERAAMKRDAMLATGTQGMQAANQSASMAATEQAQKQQAYTGALAGVRAGDVSGAQAQTQIGAANQGANLQAQATSNQQALAAQQANQAAGLQAQTTTGQQGLTAAMANQAAGLQAQQGTFTNASTGWQNQVNAQNQSFGTALQAVGAQNQAQGVAAGYGAKQDEIQVKQQAGVMGALGSVLGNVSDETAKSDVTPLGKEDFLAWKPAGQDDTKGFLQGGPSDTAKPGGTLGSVSDERTKRDVSRMGDREIADWAEAVPTAAFRYKPGIDGAPDDGERYHLGTLARQLEQTGPMGKMLVTERPDGFKQVEYGPTALMVGKGALSRADEALEWARAAYAMAAERGVHGKGLVTRG